ncbi:nuclear transport factor 2 family protein [Rhizobiales bacterium RZME27]|uniref:Nuclear transport factor 2 family protein n=1 Tax=Endobacterium cereale TaxID=2663029 RepID=A0A6A8A3M4_9HYPH|nr:nuclear transport factor 2 family protein [Endobacterium cereale]MEB2846505.1 nuclear transport factor 2 family protein [Endobacterium cereale]MQY45379.1 nuclear transport factor 2 family protein [Endobacterium cereale]
MQKLVENFMGATNAFDMEGTLALFAQNAVIDDVSVGDAFVGKGGVRTYLERFFVGYNTASKLISVKELDSFNATVRLDFTGDFGHEVGILAIAVNPDGLIARIDADLE